MFLVLNVEVDLINLSAFTSLVMVEISRLDAVKSDKMSLISLVAFLVSEFQMFMIQY